MSWEKYINADEVKRAVSALQASGSVFEVRVIGTAKKDIFSGYFRDADTLLKALDKVNMSRRNVYITLGKVKTNAFHAHRVKSF